ncbi:MAG: ATP-binding protein [bacterium]
MGLSISFSIIRQHNGSIDVVSAEGEGTTFTVRLPAQNQIRDYEE